MKTYWFSIATPGKYRSFARDLMRSAALRGIEIDILGESSRGNHDSKLLKIEGILNAPTWADHIVFIDADTLIVDPTNIEQHNGVILEPWKHKEGMYTVDCRSKETRRKRLDCLWEACKREGIPEGCPGDRFGSVEWNTGVISGHRKFMMDLALEWKRWWNIVLDCNDGKFRRDQLSFKFAYIKIHKKKYGYEDLPRVYNWLIKRWGYPPEAKILHKAGNPNSTLCRRWEEAKKDIFQSSYCGIPRKKQASKLLITEREGMEEKVWINPYKTCKCRKNCKHSGMHSYVDDYKKVLDLIQPESILEWGPGEQTRLATERGIEVFSIEQNEKWIPEIDSEIYLYRIVSVKDPEYVSLPGDRTDWDLFFVDSRRRQECIDLAFERGKSNSVVCLHDAQRERYHPHLRRFPYVVFLSQGFCVASRDPKILKLVKEK